MKPDIKQILYATDLSENARYAFGHAADLADKYDAQITIVYVMEKMNHLVESHLKDMLGKDEWTRLKTEKHDELVAKIRKRLEDFCSEMDARIASCRLLVDDIIIKQGQPAEEILKTAKKISADMTVIGSYGHNLIESALLGGTARKVLQGSTTPVLVVRLPE